MMGQQKSEAQLFNYAVNLEKRVRSNHPLRKVKAAIDFGFAREEVAHCYGKNGNESVAPEVILKMIFLLFFDEIKSERELMEVIGERLDYLWFLDYGLDENIPDHSVLSKARARWGREVFESLFVRTVAQCVEAGLVDGNKLHVDSSLVDADAAKESVIKGAPPLITALGLEGVMSLFLSLMVIGISLPDGQNAAGRIRWGALSSALPRRSAGSDFPR